MFANIIKCYHYGWLCLIIYFANWSINYWLIRSDFVRDFHYCIDFDQCHEFFNRLQYFLPRKHQIWIHVCALFIPIQYSHPKLLLKSKYAEASFFMVDKFLFVYSRLSEKKPMLSYVHYSKKNGLRTTKESPQNDAMRKLMAFVIWNIV